MKCKKIMSHNIKSCTPECSVRDAVLIMKEQNCGVVPVVNESNQVQGIVTDRDVALYTVLNEKDPDTTKLKEFMNKKVVTCFEDDDIESAITKMQKSQIRRIPIVNQENELLGLISLGDLAVKAGEKEEHEAFETLEKISEPVHF